MELMITGDFLDQTIAILFKQHKMADVIEQQFPVKEAFHDFFQLKLKQGLVVLVLDRALGQKAFLIGR